MHDQTKNVALFCAAALTTFTLFLAGCKKPDQDFAPKATAADGVAAKITLPVKTNPLSRRNFQKAKQALKANGDYQSSVARMPGRGNEPEFLYFKFNPQELDKEAFQVLEADTTVHLLDIPFANMAIYGDDFALDSTKALELQDGNMYGVTPISNSNLLSVLGSNERIQFRQLDTLVQIAEEDTALQFQAFREAGFDEDQIARFRICLFKRPQGHVYYEDGALNRLEPVRNIQVWSLFLGIPIYDYTDDNGY